MFFFGIIIFVHRGNFFCDLRPAESEACVFLINLHVVPPTQHTTRLHIMRRKQLHQLGSFTGHHIKREQKTDDVSYFPYTTTTGVVLGRFRVSESVSMMSGIQSAVLQLVVTPTKIDQLVLEIVIGDGQVVRRKGCCGKKRFNVCTLILLGDPLMFLWHDEKILETSTALFIP